MTPASSSLIFGELLRRYRMAAGLTQAELAERAGLSTHGVSDLERGARRVPRPGTVRLLADALSLPPADRARLAAAAQQQPMLALAEAEAPDSADHQGSAEGALSSARAPVQTFLIADVRGYTHFTASYGDEAAGRLTTRFAAVVRDLVAGQEGHLLEVRGDEALVVFASPRQALRAAVALQTQFTAAGQVDPSLPLPVGIGLDAGEAVEVEDGYRGGALNRAARLCSIAGPGEVLASEEVVHLAGRVDGLIYANRRAVQLKGFADPVHVVAVMSRDAATAQSDGQVGIAASPAAAAVADITQGSGSSAGDEGRRAEWGDAPSVEDFCGRDQELSQLQRWVVDEHRRVVAIIGVGGVGKTTFTTRLARQVSGEFDYVFWRSLQNAPPPEVVVRSCVSFLTARHQVEMPQDVNEQVGLLMECLQKHRCLLILDNMESVLKSGDNAGHYRDGYEGYGQLVRRIGGTDHRSCLLLTSREKPRELVQMEGASAPVRSLQLAGFGQAEGQQLLQSGGLVGSEKAWGQLIEFYAGNPLALKLVSVSIRDLFDGDIAEFLREERGVFGDVRELLEQQFARLTELEQSILYWLAIEREGASVRALEDDLVPRVTRADLLTALDSLNRRCMIERRETARFTLQPVVMEFLADKLLHSFHTEIVGHQIGLLATHALMKAQTKDYVRYSQTRLLVHPLAERLLFGLGREGVERKVREILASLRTADRPAVGYTVGNLINILVDLNVDLGGYDFSNMDIWQAYLQGVNLSDASFAHANFAHCVFSETFGSVLSLAFSPNGEVLAAGTINGEVQLWQSPYSTPVLTFHAHDDWVFTVAFSPDGKLLASGSGDQTIRLWDVATGREVRRLQGHGNTVFSVAFSSDGRLLASGSSDRTIRLWDVTSGNAVQLLEGHTAVVRALAFSPDGARLASGSEDQTIRLWDTRSWEPVAVLEGHTAVVRAVTFSPDGTLLASGSVDQTIRLWDVATAGLFSILPGHTRGLAFSPDGQVLATGGGADPREIRLWEVSTGQPLKTLRGHYGWVTTVAFNSQGRLLASGSEDQTVRLWDVPVGQSVKTLEGQTNPAFSIAFSPTDANLLAGGYGDRDIRIWDTGSGRCVKTLRGHDRSVRAVAISADGLMLASGGTDQTVQLWDLATGVCLRTLEGHEGVVWSASFSPDGALLATGGADRTIRVWDTATGQCLHVLEGSKNWVWTVAFSPDGSTLAGGRGDATIELWDTATYTRRSILQGHGSSVFSIAFDTTGGLLISGSGDRTARIWHARTGLCLRELHGHTSIVSAVAYCPDGRYVASGSFDRSVRLWDAHSGELARVLQGMEAWVFAIKFSPDGQLLASGGNEGAIRTWQVQTGAVLRTLKSDRLYERMDITGVTGLSEAQKAMLKRLGAVEHESVRARAASFAYNDEH